VGKRFGFLDQGDDIDGIMAAISQYLSYAAIVGVYSEFHRLAAKLLSFLPQKQGSGMAAMGKFANAQVQQRLSTTAAVDAADDKHPNQKGDFLSKMLNLHHENPEKITLKDVFMTCITNIGAGSDTTSISLCSVFYHLCKYPEVAQKLRAEIDEKTAAGELDDPITFKQAQSMPYLQAVLKEALRVHPATGLPLGRVVPSGGAAIAGRAFPAGVSFSAKSLSPCLGSFT
jgi:cytochrome P450